MPPRVTTRGAVAKTKPGGKREAAAVSASRSTKNPINKELTAASAGKTTPKNQPNKRKTTAKNANKKKTRAIPTMIRPGEGRDGDSWLHDNDWPAFLELYHIEGLRSTLQSVYTTCLRRGGCSIDTVLAMESAVQRYSNNVRLMNIQEIENIERPQLLEIFDELLAEGNAASSDLKIHIFQNWNLQFNM